MYRFKAMVDCEHFTVFAFQGEHRVSSFRCAALSQKFLEILELMSEEDTSTMAQTMTASSMHSKIEAIRSRKSAYVDTMPEEDEAEVTEEGTELSKEDVRRIKKQQRAKEVCVCVCTVAENY